MSNPITRCLLTTSIALGVITPSLAQAEPVSQEQLQQLIERAEKAALRAEAAAARLEQSVNLVEAMVAKDEVAGAINAFIRSLPKRTGEGLGYKVGELAPIIRVGKSYKTSLSAFGIDAGKPRRSQVIQFGAMDITATPMAEGTIKFVATTGNMVRVERWRRGELRRSEDIIKHDGFVITALWNKELQLFNTIDLATSNVRIADTRGREEPFFLSKLTLGKGISADATGAWKNDFYLNIGGLRTSDGEFKSVKELNYSGTSTGPSLAKLLQAEQAITTRMTSAIEDVEESEIVNMVKPLLAQFDTHSQTLEVKGFRSGDARNPIQGVELLKLVIAVDGVKRDLNYTLDMLGLDVGDVPVPKDLIPTKFNGAGRLANLPKDFVSNVFNYTMGQSAPSTEIAALLELPRVKNSEVLKSNPMLREHILRHPEILQEEGLQKMLSLTDKDLEGIAEPKSGDEMLLDYILSAGITSESSGLLVNGLATLTEKSALVISKDAKHQMTGSSLYQLTGLDAMQQLIKDQAKSQEAEAIGKVLAVMAAISDRKKEGDQIVDNYAFDVNKDGTMTLNGKDISEMMKNF